jgi:aminoglycoside phosphotransferase (APT) family kinase protein
MLLRRTGHDRPILQSGAERKRRVDLTDVIQWAGRAAIPGTDANSTVLAGLRSIIKAQGQDSITNPVSSPRDGATPDLTRVLLCSVRTEHGTQRFCVKLYPSCPEGKEALDTHALLLSRLKNTVPVPDVVAVLAEADQFGFPALVTTAAGQPLDRGLTELPALSQDAIVVRVAEAVAVLHDSDPRDLCMDAQYDTEAILGGWQEDAGWYEENAERAGKAADLVREGASVLAGHSDVPPCGGVLHRDLTPHNILTENGAIALVDWDHAGFSAPQEDVGKIIIGLLGMLLLARSLRLPLARIFLDTYSQRRSLSAEELFVQSVPFALDTLLDWVVGGKNAPREELSWATEQILRKDGI